MMNKVHSDSETARSQEVAPTGLIRCNIFADDAHDEFRVVRENGQEQGIFKVWAAPVIAGLEGMEPIAWADRLRNNPLGLFECLETWRAIAARADRDLQKLFDAEILPSQDNLKAAELFARLQAAFAVNAPFYHIEAMVADSRAHRPDNPIEFSGDAIMAGKLDAVAMLLPAAVEDLIIAEPGDWHSLSWERIHNMLESLNVADDCVAGGRNRKIKTVLHKVASIASLSVDDVVFAANALEFIPQQVGGKKADFAKDEALELLENVLEEQPSRLTTTSVAKDMNALIRFLNWTPSIRSDANFKGKNWMYDSVCATANELVELVSANPEAFFDDDFSTIFKQVLVPQLDAIDATSAKGRFMLQLLQEGKFTSEATECIAKTSAWRVPGILAHLETRQADIDFDDFSQVSQVGGKVIGLRNATDLFGDDTVVSSKVLPVRAVNQWLMTIDGVPELLKQLESQFEGRADIAEKIRHLIITAEPPHDMLKAFTWSINKGTGSRIVFRSSSFDEDVDVIGPAPGIYESVIDIDSTDTEAIQDAFKSVVASFFSTKAVHFRDLKGLRHKPVMAVLGQEMIDGPGGTAFVNDGIVTLNIASSPSEINNLDASNQVEQVKFMDIHEITSDVQLMISSEALKTIGEQVQRAYEILGPVDMEFVVDATSGKMSVLQLRRLEHAQPQATISEHIGRMALLPSVRLSDLGASSDKPVRLVMNNDDDVEAFQGKLFHTILTSRQKIGSVVVPATLPPTCHFVNILMTMGIPVEFSGERDE